MKIAIALVLFYVLHSLLADNRVKQLLQSLVVSKRWYRIFYNLIAIMTLSAVLWYFVKTDGASLFETPKMLRFFCFLIFGLGLGLLIQSLRQYDLREFTGLSYLDENYENNQVPRLNTKGLNTRVRHPLYLAILLLIWSSFFLFPSSNFLLFGVISSLYIWIGSTLEEQKLVLTFGDIYRNYQNQVPMLFPRIWPSKQKSQN